MIVIEGLEKTYGSHENRADYVIRKVDLTIAPGQFLCALGPSGCGKTTLLNLLAGFLLPTAGKIHFAGEPVTAPGPDRAVVFQEPTLFPWLTVLGNVMFGLRLTTLNPAEQLEKARFFLCLTGMDEHAQAYPHTLSGGMRQRVAIARALALEPKVLLLDEPFSSLDTNTRERLQDELLKIWQQLNLTVFYVTHSVSEAAYLADRIIVMGGAPGNIQEDFLLSLARPRERSSQEVREIKQLLRQKLKELPCCISR